MKNINTTEVIKWAEGRKHSEAPKYTWWSGGESSSMLGGFTLTNQGKYNGSEVDGSVKVTAHTSAGLSYWKHFDIPLDRVEDFCNALMKVRDFELGVRKSKEHLKKHNE